MTNGTYTFTGANGVNIAFDDVTYTILRDSLEGFSTYPAEYVTTQTPGNIGENVINTVIGPREISMQVIVWGDGREELEAHRRTLIQALNPLLGSCKFYWHREDGTVYYLVVRPSEDSPAFDSGTAPDAKFWQCTVDLTCSDPCWHAVSDTTYTLISDELGFHLPFQVPFTFGNASPDIEVVNDGTAPAPVKIEMNGPLTAPIVLTNQTTGESITVRKNVLTGDKLTIDTDRNDLTVTYYNHTAGTTSNALSYCSAGSKFWSLVPGANQIHLSIYDIGDGASSTLKFRERQVAL